MRIRPLQRIVATAALVAAVFMPGAPLAVMRSASAAATVSIAALAAANLGKGAGNCSTVNSSDNSLGGSQFNGSCTAYHSGAEYWCANFVKWVWQNAVSGTINVAGLDASAASFYSYGSRNETLHTSPSYQPQVGDAIVYDYDGQGHADHVGLVTSVSSDGTITTENGDWSGVLGYGMAKFAETSEVMVTTLQPNEVAVGSTPSSMDGMTISAYVTPATATPAAPASTCSPTPLTKALAVANPQLNSINWKLKSYACASGWAVVQIYAPTVGNGTAFLQQTASGWNSDALGEVNCSDIPGPLGTPLPPQALTVSLLSKAGICASGNATPSPSLPLPDFYYANAVLPEKLYVSPTYPKELAIDNHDGIAIHSLDAWGPASMTMTGVLSYDECQPDCAAGPIVTFPVQVIATAPQTCTLQVDQLSSTLPKQAYVYSEISVRSLSRNPPSYLVGNSVFKVCR